MQISNNDNLFFIFITDNVVIILNSHKKITIYLNGIHLTVIFILSSLAFLPLMSQDVFATIHQITIPEGAADSRQPIHYLPSEVTVTVNDQVQWYNTDSTTHTATSGSFQGGPDGLFNSGLLEPNDFYIYQPSNADVGKLSFYCTLHPWMNGIITVLDPEGMTGGRVAQAGSLQAALNFLEEAQSFVQSATEYRDLEYDNQAAASYIQAAINYHNSALEYELLNDHENAARYHHEAAIQHHNAAVHFEKSQDFTQSVVQHHHAGVHHHFAGVSHQTMGDHKTAGKHFAESLLHKRMAKFGSDYTLPPKLQMAWLTDSSEVSCKEGLEIILKSTTKEPACVKPSSIEKLIERGWGIKA